MSRPQEAIQHTHTTHTFSLKTSVSLGTVSLECSKVLWLYNFLCGGGRDLIAALTPGALCNVTCHCASSAPFFHSLEMSFTLYSKGHNVVICCSWLTGPPVNQGQVTGRLHSSPIPSSPSGLAAPAAGSSAGGEWGRGVHLEFVCPVYLIHARQKK